MPGSFGYEEKDAKLFASWGVDFQDPVGGMILICWWWV
jgi:hypothetical protein